MTEQTSDNLQEAPSVPGSSTEGQATPETATVPQETPTVESTTDTAPTKGGEDKSQDSTDPLHGFKSPEELSKGYQELRNKMSQRDANAKIAEQLAEKTGMTADQLAQEIERLGAENQVNMPEPQPSRYMAQERQPAQQQEQPQSLPDKVNSERRIDAVERALYEQKETAELNSLPEEAQPYKEQIKRIGRVETQKTHQQIYDEVYKPAIQAGTDKAYKGIDAKELSQPQSGKSSGMVTQSEQELRAEAKSSGDFTKILKDRIGWQKK